MQNLLDGQMFRHTSQSDAVKAIGGKRGRGAHKNMSCIPMAERAADELILPKCFPSSYPIWKAVL